MEGVGNVWIAPLRDLGVERGMLCVPRHAYGRGRMLGVFVEAFARLYPKRRLKARVKRVFEDVCFES